VGSVTEKPNDIVETTREMEGKRRILYREALKPGKDNGFSLGRGRSSALSKGPLSALPSALSLPIEATHAKTAPMADPLAELLMMTQLEELVRGIRSSESVDAWSSALSFWRATNDDERIPHARPLSSLRLFAAWVLRNSLQLSRRHRWRLCLTWASLDRPTRVHWTLTSHGLR